jgi:7,8-dihydropterin-6-yl-methyl-4-(beta-D-ribofuranosyl)aminobenzene 5'-phosphate synthase
MAMNPKVQITVLVDNAAVRPDLLTEHGLSMWIEYGDKRILWDTGQSDMLLTNARVLGVDLAAADIIAISHGHYDHTSGLPAVLAIAHKAELYFHPDSVLPRYSQKKSIHPVGMPLAAVQSLKARSVHLIESWMQIEPGVYLTGPIPRRSPFESTGGAFYLDAECRVPDSITDDQALVLESEKGLVVVLGCAHSGVVNTLDYVSFKTGKKTIHTVIGGMHLINANKQRLDHTVEAFRQYDVQNIIPLHCTGQTASNFLKTILDDRIISLSDDSCLIL